MNFRKNLEVILCVMNLPDYKSLSSCFAHSISKEINVHESTQPSVDVHCCCGKVESRLVSA